MYIKIIIIKNNNLTCTKANLNLTNQVKRLTQRNFVPSTMTLKSTLSEELGALALFILNAPSPFKLKHFFVRIKEKKNRRNKKKKTNSTLKLNIKK